MPRVKRGTQHVKRRNSLLSKVKGFRWGRKSKIRQAREALLHAGKHAYAHRKTKKRDFRQLWNTKIGAAAKLNGTSYSKLIHDLKLANIELDRKVLAQIAAEYPEIFSQIVKTVSK